MTIKTLSRTGVPGFHNPDISRRHDGKYNVWALGWTQSDVDAQGEPTFFSSGWFILSVEDTFKAALKVSRAYRKAHGM